MERMLALLLTVSLTQAQVYYGYAPAFGYAGALGYTGTYAYGRTALDVLAPTGGVTVAAAPSVGVTPASTTKLSLTGFPYHYAPFYTSAAFASPAVQLPSVTFKASDATEEASAESAASESGLPAGLSIRRIFPVFEDSDLKSPLGGAVKFLRPDEIQVDPLGPAVVSVRTTPSALPTPEVEDLLKTALPAQPLAPAGIVQATAPRFVSVPFKNANVSPLLAALSQPSVITI